MKSDLLGAVLKTRCTKAICVHVQQGTLILIPIASRAGASPHRADVRLDDAEAEACGLDMRYPIARAASPFRVTASKLPGTTIGQASPALLARIMAAVRRELQAQALERAGQHRPA